MSLKGDTYEEIDEVKTRVEGSIVLYDGRPVYITKVGYPEAGDDKEIARVYFRQLPYVGGRDGGETRKYLSSKKFDLAPFKMGYINYGRDAYFLARTPVRQYKQGLSGATLTSTDVMGKKVPLSFADLIQKQAFVDMFDGKYPSFRDAGELLGEEKNNSVAISRTFAFTLDHELEALYLLHKGVKCGLAYKKDRGIRVPPKFNFLREEMEESRIPIL